MACSTKQRTPSPETTCSTVGRVQPTSSAASGRIPAATTGSASEPPEVFDGVASALGRALVCENRGGGRVAVVHHESFPTRLQDVPRRDGRRVLGNDDAKWHVSNAQRASRVTIWDYKVVFVDS